MIVAAPSADILAVGLNLAKDGATILAAVLAAVWFCKKWQFGRRATITVDCAFFPLETGDLVLAEIAVKLKNAGDVKQDLYGFDMSISSLDESILTGTQGSRQLSFTRILVPNGTVEVRDGDLRPGVERLYTFPFVLRQASPLIQISVAIRYHSDKPAINRVDKIFIPMPRVDLREANHTTR